MAKNRQKQKDVPMNFENMQDHELIKFLSETNQLTIKWSNFIFGKKTNKFLQMIWFNPEKIAENLPSEKLEEWNNEFEQIKQIFKLEKFMYEKYQKFIVYSIKRITKKIKYYYSHCDFVNEAYIVFKKCIWFYSNNNFKFTTYLYKSINSMVKNLVFRDKNSKLKIKFESENLDIMSKPKKEIGFPETIDENNFDLDKIINNSNLNEKEISLLKIRFKLDRKWIEEAKKTILKPNGKSYTTFGLRIILNKALDKIKNKYSEKSFNIAS